MDISGTRLDSRRDLMEQAHEGHEEYHSEVTAVEDTPMWWAYRYGYDSEVLRNWRPSGRTMMGLVAILAGLVAALIIFTWLLGLYLAR